MSSGPASVEWSCLSGQLASLVLEPTAKSKRVKTIGDWLHAFHIFGSIYTQKYPHESPELMKYCQIIQDLASRGHNWFYYDENFRFLRQTQAMPVRLRNLQILLQGYNPKLVDTLISGFSLGFRIHFSGAEHSFEAPNLRSALDNPAAVDLRLKKELEAGRLAGPFHALMPLWTTLLTLLDEQVRGVFCQKRISTMLFESFLGFLNHS